MTCKFIAPLVLFVSAAPAFAGHVQISGYGKFGLDYSDAQAATNSETTSSGTLFSSGRFGGNVSLEAEERDTVTGNSYVPVGVDALGIIDTRLDDVPLNRYESLLEKPGLGFNIDGGLFLEYETYTGSSYSFLGFAGDISYNAELGDALWGFGVKALAQQVFGVTGFVELKPYASLRWNNSFASVGYVTSAENLIIPNFASGSPYYSYARDEFISSPGVLVGTEINNKFVIAASYDAYGDLSLAGKAKINNNYSVIGGVTANQQWLDTYGFIGMTADFDRTRVWGLFSLYNGGYAIEGQIDYAINDRLTATGYAFVTPSNAGYFLSGSYQLLSSFASGQDVDLVAGFGSNNRVSAGLRIIF